MHEVGLLAFRHGTDVIRHRIADVGRRRAFLQPGEDVLDLETVEVGERVEIDQGGRFQVAEPDAGRFKKPPLAAGIYAVEFAAGGRLEGLLDPLESLAFGNRAVVQVDGEFAGRLAVEKVVEGNHAFDFDFRHAQRVAGGCNVLLPNVAVCILRGPQVVQQIAPFQFEPGRIGR